MKKFLGEITEYKKAVDSLSLRGNWEDGNNCIRFKTLDGGIIIWYPTTGSIVIQGNNTAQSRVSCLIESLDFEKFQIPKSQSIKISDEEENENYEEMGKKIFVVHGHDVTSREQLELILHKLGLEPFVLANTAGGGMTIIEALEQEIGRGGNCSFGIVLLTPDDIGYAKLEGESNAQPRARQNVVLEMGMLISALGRKNTVILKKGHVEVPSDANGILYISFNEHVKEIVPKLAGRLKDSGFEIDSTKLANAIS